MIPLAPHLAEKIEGVNVHRLPFFERSFKVWQTQNFINFNDILLPDYQAYYVTSLLAFKDAVQDDILIDIECAGSVFWRIARESKKLISYRQDQRFHPKGLTCPLDDDYPDTIGGWIEHIPEMMKGTIKYLTVNMRFQGLKEGQDTELIQYANDALIRKGAIVISPFFLSAFSKEIGHGTPKFVRVYDPESFQNRILNHAEGMEPTLIAVEKGRKILFWSLILKKL